MSSADTNNPGIKLQAAGENLNTWGDPNLNNDLIILSNLASKWNPLTVNASVDFNTLVSNYSTTNPDEVATIKLVQGTVAAAFNVTFTARMKRILFWNATNYTATLKLSASSGFSLPSGRFALVSTDGANDVYNLSPNYGGVATPLNGLDIPAWSAVQSAIATAGLPATSGTILNSGADTTSGYNSQKNTAKTNGGFARSTLNAGANEQNQFAIDPTNLAVSTNVAATDLFVVYDVTAPGVRSQARSNVVGKYGLILQATQTTGFTAVAGNIYPVDVSSAALTITLPASATVGDSIGFIVGGINAYTLAPNGLKVNGGTSSLVLFGEQTFLLSYHSASRGWV